VKTAIITGTSSGIGRAIHKELENQDWEVIGLTRGEMDLAKLDDVAHEARKLADKTPRLDALIHVAGIWHDHEKVLANRDLEDFEPREIIDTMNVGVTSFMLLVAALLPKLTKSGAVIGISGTFESGATGWLPYYTSKRALEDFLVGLAEDYPSGPRVFGISPADTATEVYKKFYPKLAAEAQPPEAIAALIAKLVEGDSPYKSGDIIELRGGKPVAGFHK
jgi:NAD(P)-dependent dehydrogenase (short-subunit alcohol dehydrogenase family)